MPTYTYQEILPDNSLGPKFEIIQAMSDDPLTQHPVTGRPIQKIIGTAGINSKYTEISNQKALENKNLTEKGFTKYEKDNLTGRYHRTSGNDPRAPEIIEKPDSKDWYPDQPIEF